MSVSHIGNGRQDLPNTAHFQSSDPVAVCPPCAALNTHALASVTSTRVVLHLWGKFLFKKIQKRVCWTALSCLNTLKIA